MIDQTITSSLRVLQVARACAFLLLLGVAHVAAAQQPWISIQAGGTLRLVDDTVERKLQVVVGLAGVAAEDVKLAKMIVLRDNVQLPAERAAGFEVEEKLSAVGAAYLATIKVAAGKVTLPGSYEIWISAQAAKPANTLPLILKVTVEHPAATVAVLEPVKIRIVREDAAIDATPLKLELKGDVARLDNPVLGPVVFPEATAPVPGKIELASPLQAFGKGPGLQRGWKTEGEFPLGTLEGVAQLSGDQLKDPVAVKVSVKTRRSLIWLYVVATLALLLGLGVRTGLASYLELRRARSEGLSMLEEAKRQLLLHPDESLEEALKDDMGKLANAVASGTKDEIAAAAGKVKDALPKALDTLWKARQAKKTEMDKWLQVVALPHDLPAEVDAAVVAGRVNLQAAAELVSTSVAKADKKLAESTHELRRGLLETVGSWKRLVADRLKVLQDAKTLTFPLEVSQEVSADATALANNLDAVVKLDGLATAESVDALLGPVEALRRQAQIGLVQPASERLGSVVGILLQRLAPMLTGHQDLAAGIESAREAVQKKLAGDTVEHRLRVLAPGGAEEITALDNRILEVFSTFKAPKKEDQDTIDTLVNQRDYLGAAAKLREARPITAAAPEGEDFLLGSAAAAAARTSKSLEAALRRHAKVVVLPSRFVELSPLEPFASLEDVRLSLASTRSQIFAAEALQTLAIGILFGLIAYALYADQFAGTGKELIAIFFWAFGLDLTVAKVLEAGKALK